MMLPKPPVISLTMFAVLPFYPFVAMLPPAIRLFATIVPAGPGMKFAALDAVFKAPPKSPFTPKLIALPKVFPMPATF